MFMSIGKLEGPLDMLSDGLTEALRMWLYYGLFLFREGARHEAMGCYPLIHSERPCHAEMVEFACMAGRWMTAPFLRGFI